MASLVQARVSPQTTGGVQVSDGSGLQGRVRDVIT